MCTHVTQQFHGCAYIMQTRDIANDQRRIRQQPTENMQAYKAYVRGKIRAANSSFQALREAEQHYREAIELDPDYLLPRIGVADVIQQQAATGAITVEEARVN